MEIKTDIIKQALKPTDAKQYINLLKKISADKVLTAYEQKKLEEYEEQINAFQAKQSGLSKNYFIMPLSAITEFYGRSKVAMHHWKQMPGYPKHAHVGHGLINLKILNDWVVEYFYGNTEVATALAEEKLKYQKARARREELLTLELERKLISVDEIQQDLVEVLTMFKQRLMAWVKRLPPVLKMKEEKQIMKVLDDEVWQILNELSKGFDSIDEKNKEKEENNGNNTGKN